jgi:hypothetical protein
MNGFVWEGGVNAWTIPLRELGFSMADFLDLGLTTLMANEKYLKHTDRRMLLIGSTKIQISIP